MNKNSRNYSGRNVSSNNKNSSGRNRTNYKNNDIDNYNYVDRDIYSSSGNNRNNNSQRSKKKHGGRKFLKAFFCILLIIAAGALVYAHVMLSRVDRSDNVDSDKLAQYVQQPSAAPTWGVIGNDDVTNILLIGIDKNKDGSDGRSDTNILLSIDKKNKTIHMVSFLRDTYLDIPTIGKTKLNAAFAKGGAALTMQTLENNFRINIDKYVSVNCDNFESIIDKMGGLDVEMTKQAAAYENKIMGSHLKVGTNHLNGRLCMYYARMRHNKADSDGSDDFARTARQRRIVGLIIQKIKSLNPLETNKIMYDYFPLIKTNLGDGELVNLASVGVTVANYKIEKMQIPANNAYKNETINKAEVLVPNLTKNCSILREFLYGESGGAAESAEN